MQYLNDEVTIVAEGDQLLEYNVEFDEETKRMTCWIASAAGKEFAIHWTRHEERRDITAIFPRVDGVTMNASFALTSRPRSIVVKGMPASETTVRAFQFTSLETTDDDNYLQNPNVQSIGEIVADIWEIAVGEPTTEIFRVLPDAKVHERAKKAMAHRVGHGGVQPREKKGASRAIFRKRRIAEFVFKYRNLDFLQAQGIAPAPVDIRSPRVGEKRPAEDEAPEPEEAGVSDPKVRDQAELKKLLARVDELQSRLNNDGARPSSSKRVKTEPRPVVFSNEVIDLTED